MAVVVVNRTEPGKLENTVTTAEAVAACSVAAADAVLEEHRVMRERYRIKDGSENDSVGDGMKLWLQRRRQLPFVAVGCVAQPTRGPAGKEHQIMRQTQMGMKTSRNGPRQDGYKRRGGPGTRDERSIPL